MTIYCYFRGHEIYKLDDAVRQRQEYRSVVNIAEAAKVYCETHTVRAHIALQDAIEKAANNG